MERLTSDNPNKNLEKLLDIFIQKRWLKTINRQLNAVNRLIQKARKANQRVEYEKFILQKLIDEYNTKYHDGLCAKDVGIKTDKG